jgi:hypothetical protein
MNIFLFSLLISGGAFLTFVLIHVVSFRISPPKERLVFLNRVHMVVLFFTFILAYFLSRKTVLTEGSELVHLLEASTFYLIFWFFSLAFYGLIDHSIRIRIAIELARKKQSRQELMQKYAPDAAMGNRLDKMIDGGYLLKVGEIYSLTPKGLWFARIAKSGKAFYNSGAGG